jgi:hypothetical protein
MDSGAIFGLAHIIGVVVAINVMRARAGGSVWYGMPMSQMLMSPEWFVASIAKSVLWEVTLAVWLATGKPESRWGVPRDSRSGRIVRVRPIPLDDPQH